MLIDSGPYRVYEYFGFERCYDVLATLGPARSRKQPDMKKNRLVANAVKPAKPCQGIPGPVGGASRIPDESDLSPERLMNGSSSTTALLSQILAQREKFHQIRDWGINE